MTDPVIIKKYANRRLYNTSTSAYITLDELAHMIREGIEFEVVDAKTGKDLTRPVLTQILFEEETRGAAMLPVKFLRQLIGFYDDSMQSILPHYLEANMDVFSQNQQKIRDKVKNIVAPFSASLNPFENMQNLQQQQLQSLQKMFTMMNPFVAGGSIIPDEKTQEIRKLKLEIERLNAELAKKS